MQFNKNIYVLIFMSLLALSLIGWNNTTNNSLREIENLDNHSEIEETLSDKIEIDDTIGDSQQNDQDNLADLAGQDDSAQTNEDTVNEPYFEPITDVQIKNELQFIQEVLQVNKSKEEIEKAFDDRYHKYIIPRESLDAADKRGLNDVHFYIYSNKNRLLSFEVGEYLFDGSVAIKEVNENSIVTPAYEYPRGSFFLDMDLFVDTLLLTRKSGIKMEILYSNVNLVLRANVFYMNEEYKINTISYYSDGTITLYENVTREEHYRSL